MFGLLEDAFGILIYGSATLGGTVVGAGAIGVAKGYCLSQGIDNNLVDIAALGTPFVAGGAGGLCGLVVGHGSPHTVVYGAGLMGVRSVACEAIGLGYVGGELLG